MNFGIIKYFDTADGEGIRTALYVSGCTNKCKGCHNAEAWDFNFGRPFTEIELNEILESLNKPYVQGLSILGGEPFEPQNQPEVLKIILAVRARYGASKDIWVYSGNKYTDLQIGGRRFIAGVTDEILKNSDVLVDGEFILEQRDVTLQFRGSPNQNIIRLHNK